MAYDLLAGGAMLVAAAVAWLLGRGIASPRVHGLLLRATVTGSVIALLRGVPALAWDAVTAAPLTVGLFADSWFTVAGVAGLLLWRISYRRSPRPSSTGTVSRAPRAAVRSRSS